MIPAHLDVDWLSSPSLQHLFTLFETEGATLRLVGGSVRDGLLGLPVQDIDLAVDRDPQWVFAFLNANQIHAIPTGIEHGTITAVIDHKPYQITTLRVDVKTFGRRAEVAFTEDWTQDAQRRDFTINAIYADKEGILFDPVGGLEDLKNHIVKFIGDPNLRIQEDYLRILRFFRFSARFGSAPYDQAGLEACQRYASEMHILARERITEEFLKILGLPNLLSILQAMEASGVLAHITRPPTSWRTLAALLTLEEGRINPLLRLAALQPNFAEISARLRLSNDQTRVLAFLGEDPPLITLSSLKSQAYRQGRDAVMDLALLQTAQRVGQGDITEEEGVQLLKSFYTLEDLPPFPLTGEDVLAHGVLKGPQVGHTLKQVEDWWLDQDLQPDRAACLAYLATLL